MIVFKACFKILRKNGIMLGIYFFIFTFISFSIAKSKSNAAEEPIWEALVRVSVINEDNSSYGDSLEEFIKENGSYVDIMKSDEGISDALFYRYAEYIVKIPKGFGEAIENGGEPGLDKYEIAGSYSGRFMDNKINEYVSKLKLYGPNVPKSSGTEVEMLSEDNGENASVYLYNFASYALMFIVIFGVGALLSKFGEKEIHMRNAVSPMTPVKLGICQIGCCILFSLLVWICMSAVGFFVIGKENIGAAELLMTVNMLIFTLVCLAMGFFVSTLVSSENARTIVVNVLALGFSFIGGVMVPLEVISDKVKIIGGFTPTYWYVRANEVLSGLDSLDLSKAGEVWKFEGVQALFFAAFLTAGLASLKRKG